MREEFTSIEYRPYDREIGGRDDLSPGEIVGIVIGLAFVIAWGLFWLWMLINLLKRKGMDSTTKLIWLIVLVFINVIGVILYYFMVYRPDRKAVKPAPAPASTPSVGTTGQN